MIIAAHRHKKIFNAFSIEYFYNENHFKYFRVRVRYDGYVRWSPGGQFTVACTLDVTYFPFDSQKCQFIIENWMYTGNFFNEVTVKTIRY